jgi:hypothetical protein
LAVEEEDLVVVAELVVSYLVLYLISVLVQHIPSLSAVVVQQPVMAQTLSLVV